jgi:hypothetical protein
VNIDDAVGVDIEGDLHLGDAAGGGRDSHQLELTWPKRETSINQYVFRIHDPDPNQRIHTSELGLMDPDSDPNPNPAIFVSDLQDVNKKLFFFAYYFLKVHFQLFQR